MALNHLNLTVPDVRATREFFETYFGFRCLLVRGANALAVLMDESGFVLSLNNFERAAEVKYPSGFHVGFNQESRERVDVLHARLKADCFDPPPPREFHGAWTFYFNAPGGIVVEVFHQHGPA